MYGAPAAAAAAGSRSAPKPSLTGAKQKQRKGVAKAAAKFEPEQFRDQLVKYLEGVEDGDFDGYAAKLDALGNQLDYRRYEEQLFQLLLVGRLLAAGGGFVQDGAAPSPFSVLGSTKEPVQVADVKPVVEVFNKLIRRYKYLQKPFEETSIPQLLQYLQRFDAPAQSQQAAVLKPIADTVSSSEPPSRVATPTPTSAASALPGRPNQDKLATAIAIFVATGLAAPSVIAGLKKDHLVKDGTSLSFLTTYARAYLTVEPIDHLITSLRRGGVDDMLDFFPPARRSAVELGLHFKKAGLDGLADFYQKQRNVLVSKEMLRQLNELVSTNASNEEILAYLREQFGRGTFAEGDFIGLVWDGLMSNLDPEMPPEQVPATVLKEIKADQEILLEYAKSAKAEITLINTIQLWCYGTSAYMPLFPKILKQLYADDIVSDQAILFWHAKGSKAQGRQHFLKVAEPLVKFIEEQDEEDE